MKYRSNASLDFSIVVRGCHAGLAGVYSRKRRIIQRVVCMRFSGGEKRPPYKKLKRNDPRANGIVAREKERGRGRFLNGQDRPNQDGDRKARLQTKERIAGDARNGKCFSLLNGESTVPSNESMTDFYAREKRALLLDESGHCCKSRAARS